MNQLFCFPSQLNFAGSHRFLPCPSLWSTPVNPRATLDVSHHCRDHRLPPRYAAPVSNRIPLFSKWLSPPEVLCLFAFRRAIVTGFELYELPLCLHISHSTSLIPEWELMIAIAMSCFHWNLPPDAATISVSLCTLQMTHFYKGASVAIAGKKKEGQEGGGWWWWLGQELWVMNTSHSEATL